MRDELEARISRSEARTACEVIIRGISNFPEIEIRYQTRGSKKAVHFAAGRYAPYAFIANANWLLWYFRRPGLSAGLFKYEDVFSEFPAATFTLRKDSSDREVKLKIFNEQDARDVLDFVAQRRVQLRAMR